MFTYPNNDWLEIFQENNSELTDIYRKIEDLKSQYGSLKVYPEKNNIFKAFQLCPFKETKVIIIGQDCYHGPGQANGLCFSVNENIPHPPSLKNILKEMKDDINIDKMSSDFTYLANQGVLLLNSSLTVHEKLAGSHLEIWEKFTDNIFTLYY